MEQTIFYSWQSDRPARVTRNIIREALSEAIDGLASQMAEADRPASGRYALDHDTKDVPGSPEIVQTILQKIERAAVFVADVTPIVVLDSGDGTQGTGKHIANPNVLIELGYAKKAIGTDKIIQIWNTAFTNCTPEDLPFDMRGRRAPIGFSLLPDASKEQYATTRTQLASKLSEALALVLSQRLPTSNESDDWQPTRENDPSVWFEDGTKFTVNEPMHGSGQIWLVEGPTQYVRILPADWPHTKMPDTHAFLLGHVGGMTWARTTGGLITYEGSIIKPELAEGTHATMWFPSTGEVWAVDRRIAGEWKEHFTIWGDELISKFLSFIPSMVERLEANGAAFPMRCKMGFSRLSGTHWHIPYAYQGPYAALEDKTEVQFTISSSERSELIEPVMRLWVAFRDIYSLPPPNRETANKILGADLVSADTNVVQWLS